MVKRSRTRPKNNAGYQASTSSVPSNSEIIQSLADIYRTSDKFDIFLTRSLGRLETIAIDQKLSFLTLYCSTLKSYITKNANSEAMKAIRVPAVDTKRDRRSPDNIAIRLNSTTAKDRGRDMDVGQRTTGGRFGSDDIGGQPGQGLQVSPGATGGQLGGGGGGVSRVVQPIISVEEDSKDIRRQASSSHRGRREPEAAKLLDVDDIEREMILNAREKMPIHFKETMIPENDRPVIGRALQDRLDKLPNTVIKRSSSIYRFKREEEKYQVKGMKDVRFAGNTDKNDSPNNQKDELDRIRKSSMKKSPMTRGRSQSVKHDKKTNVATVKQRNDPTLENSLFLMIRDLRATYDVHYITEADEDFSDAIREISSEEVVGFDAEYRMERCNNRNFNAPSYLQFSLLDRCYVFNMNMLCKKKSSLEQIWDICSSRSLLKVGHSVLNDLEKVFEYFKFKYGIIRPIYFFIVDISKCLYTVFSTQRFSLADISHRCLGKYLRKNDRCISAGGKFDLTNELQMEYVALDALVPIRIYFKHLKLIEMNINPTPILSDDACDSHFVIDWGLWNTLEIPLRNKTKSIIKPLPKFTHIETVAYFIQHPKHVLITHDKYLLTNASICNKIPYFTIDDTLAAVAFIDELNAVFKFENEIHAEKEHQGQSQRQSQGETGVSKMNSQLTETPVASMDSPDRRMHGSSYGRDRSPYNTRYQKRR